MARAAVMLQVCLNAAISVVCGEKAPPVYLCVDCVDMLPGEQREHMVDVLKPLQTVSLKCENKVRETQCYVTNLSICLLQSLC